MEYSLKTKGNQTSQLWLSDLLAKQNLDFRYVHMQHLTGVSDEFSLNIGLNICIHENKYPPGHPAHSYETIFLEHDFVYQETVSFDFHKFNEYQDAADKKMYEIVFSIIQAHKSEAIFYHTSGEEIFYYTHGNYLFNEIYLSWLQNHHSDLLEKIKYSIFTG
ncbi:hypothetical protein B5M42_023305 [Paenibacillus athensensis]|uniref:Uncharacterized protein n=1 Tax=Paenibacillus athensensis TaxID=1967502 RepID=A0A4Y8PUI5_9BACL|nr:hypothetical protein [Paenibacillus athensensis]MCD1261734.1 hypothetical protein [Paenibacillus athensensis]